MHNGILSLTGFIFYPKLTHVSHCIATQAKQ